MDEALGVDPAQAVDADAELAGVVGDDDGARSQALMADGAPERAFGGDQDRIGSAFISGRLRASRQFSQENCSREDTIQHAGEFVENRDRGNARSFM